MSLTRREEQWDEDRDRNPITGKRGNKVKIEKSADAVSGGAGAGEESEANGREGLLARATTTTISWAIKVV